MVVKQTAIFTALGAAAIFASFLCPIARAAEPVRDQIAALALSPNQTTPPVSTRNNGLLLVTTPKTGLQREIIAHPRTLQTFPGEASPIRLAALDSNTAASTPVPVVMPEQPIGKMETGRISTRFHKGLRERGLSLGYGQKLPFGRFESRTDNMMFQFIPFKGRFRNSTQEFLWEAPIAVFTKPNTDFLAGLSIIFRQYLTSTRRFAPYVEFGVGATLTDLEVREVGGRFQFSLQGGAGIRTSLNNKTDLTIGARWYHLSNAGIMRPNTGFNDYLVTVGASRLF